MSKTASILSLLLVPGWAWAEAPGAWEFNKDGLTVAVVGNAVGKASNPCNPCSKSNPCNPCSKRGS